MTRFGEFSPGGPPSPDFKIKVLANQRQVFFSIFKNSQYGNHFTGVTIGTWKLSFYQRWRTNRKRREEFGPGDFGEISWRLLDNTYNLIQAL